MSHNPLIKHKLLKNWYQSVIKPSTLLIIEQEGIFKKINQIKMVLESFE